MKKPESRISVVLFFLLFCLLLPAEAIVAAPSTAERKVIIGFNKKPGSAERNLLRGHKGRMRHAFRIIHAFAANLPEKEISRLRADPRIKYVVEDAVVSAVEPEPSEAEYGSSWGVQHIGCDRVHDQGITGQGVKIAVIDTGIDYTHPQLSANYRGGYDFVFTDNDPYDDSWNSHGTHVAGIIAATADGTGVVGGAPDASLYAVKVLDGAGSGYLSWVVAGIEWAVDNGMDIANISIAGPNSPVLQDACAAAYNAGLLLVAAGGNTRAGDVLYPAAYDSVIAVSASYQSDLPAWFSPMDAEVELMAPGVEILSTTADGEYALLSGTSQAAPHVTAVAALLMSAGQFDANQDGLVNNRDIRLRLQRTAVDLGDEGRDEVYGFGLVDAAAAIADDGDVDGLDLLSFARKLEDGTNSIDVANFAASFGR
ncbi:MAG: S8 family peptidase [Desulfobulbaceae bacterium]|nr:S8 family peptidase [Desulfobulbaceae bacterium]